MNKNILVSSIFLFILLVPNVVFAQLQMPTFDSAMVEAKVREVFVGNDAMVEVAKCESGFRQFDSSGQPLHGGLGGVNVGVFQINENVHAAAARNLNMDIYTLEGNVNYAKLLYEHGGLGPWAGCVNVSAPTAYKSAVPIVSGLKLGKVSEEVRTLQILLNRNGFLVSESGPGSKGNETTKFGSLTREAVKRFQCAKKIVCEGNENTTGYGFVGARTRVALAELK